MVTPLGPSSSDLHLTTTEQAVIDDLSPEWIQAWETVTGTGPVRRSWFERRWWRSSARRTLAHAWVTTLKFPTKQQDVVLKWLMAAASPLWTTRLGATPLMAALCYANDEVAVRVLKATDPNGAMVFKPMIPGDGALCGGSPPDKSHPLVIAAGNGLCQVVERLLPAHRKDQALLDQALGVASQAGHLAVVDRLLPMVERPSSEWLRSAVSRGDEPTVDRLLPHVDRMTPGRHDHPALLVALQEAVLHGHARTLSRLMDADGATKHVNVDLLNEAARMGHVDGFRAVMARVDPRSKNTMGWTPLMAAAASPHDTLDVIDMLLPVSDTTARVEVGTAFDVAVTVTLKPSAASHQWARVDRLACYETNVERVNRVFRQAGPERMPLWAIRWEQNLLASVINDVSLMPCSVTKVHRQRL